MMDAGEWIHRGAPAGVPFILRRDVTSLVHAFDNEESFIEWLTVWANVTATVFLMHKPFRFLPIESPFADSFRVTTDSGPVYLAYDVCRLDERFLMVAAVQTLND